MPSGSELAVLWIEQILHRIQDWAIIFRLGWSVLYLGKRNRVYHPSPQSIRRAGYGSGSALRIGGSHKMANSHCKMQLHIPHSLRTVPVPLTGRRWCLSDQSNARPQLELLLSPKSQDPGVSARTNPNPLLGDLLTDSVRSDSGRIVPLVGGG